MIGMHRRSFIAGLASIAAVFRTSSSLTPPATDDVFSFGGGPCRSSLWVVSWGSGSIRELSPEQWRHAVRCATIETKYDRS